MIEQISSTLNGDFHFLPSELKITCNYALTCPIGIKHYIPLDTLPICADLNKRLTLQKTDYAKYTYSISSISNKLVKKIAQLNFDGILLKQPLHEIINSTLTEKGTSNRYYDNGKVRKCIKACFVHKKLNIPLS